MTQAGDIDVVAEVHGAVSGGVISGYGLRSALPSPPQEVKEGGSRVVIESSSDEGTDGLEMDIDDDAEFVEFVAPSTNDEAGSFWLGMVSTEELPGGGLHRQVHVWA